MEMTISASLLVVDDDPRNRKLMLTLLRAEGHVVRSADSGAAALAEIAIELPDAILLDIMMPAMDGFEVVRHLKADPLSRHVPIIMVTALDDEASRARLVAAGVDDVVTKPLDRWLLKGCLERVLARSRS